MHKAFTIILTALVFTVSAFAKVSTNTHADIDLTRMSSTMVYSIVYQMVTDPQKYTGKTIKMKGIFSSYVDEETNRRFFGCVIKDALACCSQGLAFELAKPRKYPSEYPSEGASITIIGTFEFEKEEDGIGFPIIKDAILFR
ncbi:hypothetical protein FSU_1656 [Fibrobacter succinogenes subsp. succinogenes S85]|uniref:Uncharacterized protein n=1 Tax=Fibrobacter succinogenes (strain ATCC 19169 / S85) TaxID=59374 RepID=C9RQG2_FIBSS|nr:hypothetical protein [Fibrobacter succinogenes]ACX74798.1 hypothetical protein Fisuc_1195 [Fibrobacter succinogenes subsp. succinogenes S85]ADL27005.1 hypothetical protein FSU_1656 [Fibrobacter succinogenes subsp. succinogenes S85]